MKPVGCRIVGYGGVDQYNYCLTTENQRINHEVMIEKEWWQDQVIQDEAAAIKAGHLIIVPDEGTHYRLISTLRTGNQPRTVRPATLLLLYTVQARWMLSCDQMPSIDNVFLSITSLFRTDALQKQLQEATRLAAEGISPHMAGAVIDFDPQGYYWGEQRQSVTASSDKFEPLYTMQLRTVLERLAEEGHCHVICEKGYRLYDQEVVEHDAVYHVCVSPQFFA